MPIGPRYASPEEVEEQAQDWPDEFLQCRRFGHPWQPYQATHNTTYRYYYEVLICPRCTAERHSEMTESGHVTASWMRYPEGYLTKKIGRIVGDGRDMIRIVAMTRMSQVTNSRKAQRPHSSATRHELGIL